MIRFIASWISVMRIAMVAKQAAPVLIER